MRGLVSKLSNEGDVVLDSFCGSGTTARACKDLGRHYIGIEIHPAFVKIAEERLRQEVLIRRAVCTCDGPSKPVICPSICPSILEQQ